MEIIAIESKAFQDIIDRLDAINKRLNDNDKLPKVAWLDNVEFMALMKISKRTAQHYRDSGLISFSQVGAKIYYRVSDIEDLLHRHYNKSFAK